VPRQLLKRIGKKLCYLLIAVLTLSPAFSAAMMSAEMGNSDRATESGQASHMATLDTTHGDMHHGTMPQDMHDDVVIDAGHDDHSGHSTLCQVACAGIAVTLFDSRHFEFTVLPADRWRIAYSLKPERSGGTPLLQPPRV